MCVCVCVYIYIYIYIYIYVTVTLKMNPRVSKHVRDKNSILILKIVHFVVWCCIMYHNARCKYINKECTVRDARMNIGALRKW